MPEVGTATVVVAEPVRANDMLHTYCECDPDKALCGKDVTGVLEGDDGDPCVVCEDLLWVPCPYCGAA